MPRLLAGRGPLVAFHRKLKTHCVRGHEYSVENTHFEPNARGEVRRYCRTCGRERMRRKREMPGRKERDAEKTRRWRARDPEHANKLWRDARSHKKRWIDSLKVQCARCDERHPACLDFHHRNPAEKEFLLSLAVARYSLGRIQAEAAKCDILCANCHRKHHYDEKMAALIPGRE